MDMHTLAGIFMILIMLWGVVAWVGWGLLHDKREAELEEFEALKKEKALLERENIFLKSRITKYELAEAKKNKKENAK